MSQRRSESAPMRDTIKEPFTVLKAYGDLQTRILLSRRVPEENHSQFVVRFEKYISQKQTKWALALLRGRCGWTPLRAILEYRRDGVPAVLDAFIDIMKPATEQDLFELALVGEAQKAKAVGQLNFFYPDVEPLRKRA